MTAGLWADGGGPPVVAFGGNALLPDPRDPGAAEANAAAFADLVIRLMPVGSNFFTNLIYLLP